MICIVYSIHVQYSWLYSVQIWLHHTISTSSVVLWLRLHYKAGVAGLKPALGFKSHPSCLYFLCRQSGKALNMQWCRPKHFIQSNLAISSRIDWFARSPNVHFLNLWCQMKKYLSKLKKRKELIWNSSFTLSWGQYLLALKMNIHVDIQCLFKTFHRKQ